MEITKSHALDGCRVNYIKDEYNSEISNVTGFQYRFFDKDNKAFPILISTHAYGVIMKQIKAMMYSKQTERTVDKHIKIGDQSIKVEKIQYYGTRPIEHQNSDKDFTVTIFDESRGESVEFHLANKNRVSHPDRKSFLKAQRETYGKYKNKKKANQVVRVNNLGSQLNNDSDKNIPTPAPKVNFVDEIDNRINEIQIEINKFEELKGQIDSLKNRLEMLKTLKEEFSK